MQRPTLQRCPIPRTDRFREQRQTAASTAQPVKELTRDGKIAELYGGEYKIKHPDAVAVYAIFPGGVVELDPQEIRGAFMQNEFSKPVFLGRGRRIYAIEGDFGPFDVTDYVYGD